MDHIKIAKALSELARYKIVKAVSEKGALSCGEIEGLFELSQPTISHHCRILNDSGLVKMKRTGQKSMVSLNKEIFSKYTKRIHRDFKIAN
ncbi:MAG: helix-turn-helix transcriptional regulator [Flavobacteriales bacterium]|nr:helix-turn-helix transcriptional regulator [Flavobacteriales bacterium]